MSSTQRTFTTAAEGGIPTQATTALHVIGADEQAVPSDYASPDATISSIPLSESRAIVRNPPPIDDPEDWPREVRGMPHYRPLNRNLNFQERPMGQNGGEFTFLVFMVSGVSVVAVSDALGPDLFCLHVTDSSRSHIDRLRTMFGVKQLDVGRTRCLNMRLVVNGDGERCC